MLKHCDVIMEDNNPNLLRIVLRLPSGGWVAPWLVYDGVCLNMTTIGCIEASQEEITRRYSNHRVVFSINKSVVKAVEEGVRRRLADEEEAAPF